MSRSLYTYSKAYRTGKFLIQDKNEGRIVTIHCMNILYYFADDVTFVKDALEKVNGKKTFVETLQEQDAKLILRACMEDNAADVCTEANMAGTCNDDGMCDCNEGFTGEDCSGMYELDRALFLSSLSRKKS